jgi:5-methylcytosine-specific restriction endonuclease McrBC GTP-binding regulatory subunit McrB
MKNYIEALKTKPFLLLAGISGTGKSQKVKELAYMTCPADKLNSTPTTPGNYCLIEVKPNWHDSSELLGYYSNLTEMYHVTDFLRFVYKATQNPDYPFFVCLDEMNLAPVEQYFAEYLSVLETRTVVGDHIESAKLLTKESFEGYALSDEYAPLDKEVVAYIQNNGLSLPENLFIIGTVNMDDTTHQFSRKVIDRAFTIEMNGGELAAMFSDENTNALKYRQDPVSLEVFKPKYVKATDALEDSVVGNFAEKIKKNVPAVLTKVNEILKDTPFRVSYRVQNELILYVANMILNSAPSEDKIDATIKEAALVILLEKILPRVQGDDKLLSDANGSVFMKLKSLLESDFVDLEKTAVYGEVITKLDEMDKRLTNTYFANFF